MNTLTWIGHVAHELAVAKGFYARCEHVADPVWCAARLALIHAEVSEALECVARGRTDASVDAGGKPEGLPSELADIILRVADLAYSLGIDLDEAVAQKHEYNRTRPIMHGGKKL